MYRICTLDIDEKVGYHHFNCVAKNKTEIIKEVGNAEKLGTPDHRLSIYKIVGDGNEEENVLIGTAEEYLHEISIGNYLI